MNVTITPHRLSGTVFVPASKSMAHRAIICAALAKGTSVIRNVTFSKDIQATLSVMQAFGASYETEENTVTVHGIAAPSGKASADCCESGSTLRFLIPVAAALGVETTFLGQGRLPQRPITPYLRELSQKGITFDYSNIMPFTIRGQLQSGTFSLEGDVSSQFVTGLLLALLLLEGDSDIVLTSPLQSKPYADMTIGCLRAFGVDVTETADGYHIPGGQHYLPQEFTVEGDFSQAAFFYVANAVGNNITLANIPAQSLQGDRKIVDIIHDMQAAGTGMYCLDASDIPDLVPIVAVLATFADCTTQITGAARLRIKESDRLETTAAMLNTLGGRVTVESDGLTIRPVTALHGGTVDSAGDHRIAMCAAIAATRATEPVTITGAECVEKSYPAFFRDYHSSGGVINGFNLE